MDTVLQSPRRPTEILFGLQSLVHAGTDRVRIAVAYTTEGGCRTLFPKLAALIGPSWSAIPKTLITSLDFGHTYPSALEYVAAIENFEVRITDANLSGDGVRLMPGKSNFHPKIYLFGEYPDSAALVGSPNLSARALTASTEAAALVAKPHDLEDYWDELLASSTPLNAEISKAYEAARKTRKVLDADPPLDVVQPGEAGGKVAVFGDAVAADVDPMDYECFWVDAGSMRTGGSFNQLELPRGANHFFGFTFTDYDNVHHVIGETSLFALGKDPWADRELTWHGNNGMERIYLPTQRQGGLEYPGSVVLFRRAGNAYQLQVAPPESEPAKSWRNASTALARVYKVGSRTTRLCGLF